MPRRHSRVNDKRSQATSGGGAGSAASEKLESKFDGNWWVRRISGATSSKTYRCPGCNQAIPPATPHVVAWPEIKSLLSAEAVDERRHWHTACWTRKS